MPEINISLNPCFNGRYSLSMGANNTAALKAGLNPCFNGRYSLSGRTFTLTKIFMRVLILVLMEDTH